MRFRFELDSSIAGMAEEEIGAAEKAVTAGVRRIGGIVKDEWRRQVVGGGLGQRLANAIRQKNYPAKGQSMGAASLVYAQPNRKKSASAADVIDAFDKGALIRGKDKLWLAIPFPAAGKVAGSRNIGRLTPLRWEQRTGMPLRFVYRRGKPALLVVDQARLDKKEHAKRKGGRRRKSDGILSGEMTIPIFLLLPQAQLKKRLDLEPVRKQALEALPMAVLSAWK